jgi:hypothetical protein
MGAESNRLDRRTERGDPVRRRDDRVGDAVRVRASTPLATRSTVSCIVPAHDRAGTELINDDVVVDDQPFAFELHGACGFT